jgi:hypothetical protein
MVTTYFDVAVSADSKNGTISKFMGQELKKQ